jgi:hypothetical protein
MTPDIILPPLPDHHPDLILGHTDDALEAYARAAVRLTLEARWLPIETAPKDKSRILACQLLPNNEEWRYEVVYWYQIGDWGTWMGERGVANWTHWMRLPATPTGEPIEGPPPW